MPINDVGGGRKRIVWEVGKAWYGMGGVGVGDGR